jgi:ABC-type multidrug transport system fused ATPase/permease subunit
MTKADQSMPPSATSIRVLFPWLWNGFLKRYYKLLVLAVTFMALEGGMSAMMAYMMKPLFDEGFLADNASALGGIGLAMFAIFAFRAIMSILQKVILTQVSQRSMGDIRQALLEHLMRLDPGFHQTYGPGYLIQRVEGDVGGIAKIWSTLITSAGRDLVSVIALFSLSMWLDWRWTLLICIGAPLLMVPSLLLQRYVRKYAREAREISASLSTRLNEVFQGILPVKLNRLEGWQARKYRNLTAHRVRVMTRTATGQAALPGLVDLMSGVAIAGVLYFGGREIVNETKTVGEFMAFFTAIGMLFEPLRRLGSVSGVWQVAATSIERIKELMETESELREPDHPQSPPTGTPGIELQAVHLSYGGAPVLRGLTLRAEPGKTTALVGASGAGKTTVFNLLTRMVDPEEGRVAIGNVAVDHMTTSDLRNMISVVSQEALLFDETLRENIVLDREVTDAELEPALKAAHVSDFLPRLEAGLETPVGPRGSSLSGGQRQRVSIARAILRDTPILLLDEATSALDTQSESIVQRSLEDLSIGRTTLVIAHRLSTVYNADKIIVMDQGRVVEEGSHSDLLARGGAYAELYNMQFET